MKVQYLAVDLDQIQYYNQMEVATTYDTGNREWCFDTYERAVEVAKQYENYTVVKTVATVNKTVTKKYHYDIVTHEES